MANFNKIPVLLYHDLFDGKFNKEKYAIAKKEFERQIKHLHEKGFQGILIDDLHCPSAAADGARRRVAITFDDGDYSNYSMAIPILKKYGFVATFFITVEWIGADGYMEWVDLKKMAAEGMSIQSHGLTHSFLSDLDDAGLYKELVESRSRLEAGLHRPVRFISLPGGFGTGKVLKASKDAGYDGVCTSVPGLNRFNSGKKFVTLNRFVMTRKTTFENFDAIVTGKWNKMMSFKTEHYLKSGVKKILGSRNYYALWSRFFKDVRG